MIGNFKRAAQLACLSQIMTAVLAFANPAAAAEAVYKDSAGNILGFDPDPRKTEGTKCVFKQTNEAGEVKEATVYLDPTTLGTLQIKDSDVVYQFESAGRNFLMKQSRKDSSISLHLNSGQMSDDTRNSYAALIDRKFSQLSLDLIDRCQLLATVSWSQEIGSTPQFV